MRSFFSKFIAYIQEPGVRSGLVKRLVLSFLFTTAVGIGSLGFPQEAHAWFWFAAGAAALLAGVTGIGEELVNSMGGLLFSGLAWIAFLFVKIGGYFLYVAGSIFNYALVELVFEYATNFGNSEAVLISWGVLRDFGNIALLFGFIWIGIATILNISNYTAKKALPRLLVFAILLNFSLLAASAVIDTANAFSYAFYNQASAGDCSSGTTATCSATNGLAARMIGLTGVMGWDLGSNPGFSFDSATAMQSLGAMMSLLIFITVLMVVIFAAAIMLVIRAVVLTLLIVTSPIGFVGMVVPFLGGLAKDWWDKLIKQSFFAPIYLLLLLIALKIMEGVIATSGNLTVAAALMAPDNSLMGQLVMMIMIIVFLIAALIMSRKMGAYGADFAIKTSSGVANFVTGSAGFAPLGAATRFVGGGAFSVLRAGAKKAGVLSIPGVGQYINKGLTAGRDWRGWDLRGVANAAVPKEAGIDFGRQRGVADVRRENLQRLREQKAEQRGGATPKEEERFRSLYNQIYDNTQQLIRETERLRAQGYNQTQIDAMLVGITNTRQQAITDVQTLRDQIGARDELSEQRFARRVEQAADWRRFFGEETHSMREFVRETREGWGVTLTQLQKILNGIGKQVKTNTPTPPPAPKSP